MVSGTGSVASAPAKGTEQVGETEKVGLGEESSAGREDIAFEAPSESCLLLGPPGSGKTSFIAALARAGLLAAEPACLPLGHAAWLVQDACRSLRSSTPLALLSAQDGSYSFELRSCGGGSEASDAGGQLTIHELSETKFFPAADQVCAGAADLPLSAGMVSEQIKSANYLVLCVDILRPRPDDWQIALIGLFDDLATGGGEGPSTQGSNGRCSGASLSREAPEPSPPQWRRPRTMAFDRVLLLFTRLDLLCQRVWEETVQPGRPRAWGGAGRTRPNELAERIDPIAQAIHLVGEPTLALLLSSLKPGAQLGVGFVSAGGFDPRTGLPVLDTEGRPVDRQTEGNILSRWYPFGVLECLDFLIGGRTSCTVREVNRAVLHAERRVSWAETGAEWSRRSAGGGDPASESGEIS